MSIETQKTIGDWARDTFPGGDDLSPRHCLRLLEEVAELCQAAGASGGEILDAVTRPIRDLSLHVGVPEAPQVVAEELADCAIVLAVLAGRRGVDLAAEVDRKMAINRARRWVVRGDGTGYHAREGEGGAS